MIAQWGSGLAVSGESAERVPAGMMMSGTMSKQLLGPMLAHVAYGYEVQSNSIWAKRLFTMPTTLR